MGADPGPGERVPPARPGGLPGGVPLLLRHATVPGGRRHHQRSCAGPAGERERHRDVSSPAERCVGMREAVRAVFGQVIRFGDVRALPCPRGSTQVACVVLFCLLLILLCECVLFVLFDVS